VDFLEVVSQIAARTERRVAHNANVISDPTVLLKMTQVDFPPGFGKGLATLLAFIWHLFFWSVQILSVLDQGALRAKTLTTVNTLEGFLVGVNAFVDVEKRSVSKLFGAVGAWKWVFWHLMAAPMTCQGLLGGTLFATILTHEALLFVVSHVSGKC